MKGIQKNGKINWGINMVIADSLRQEHEPSMVYSICKLIANNDYSLREM